MGTFVANLFGHGTLNQSNGMFEQVKWERATRIAKQPSAQNKRCCVALKSDFCLFFKSVGQIF